MKRLYVGCRVRILRASGFDLYPHLTGKEGVISGRCDCDVTDCPCWELHGFYGHTGRLIGFHPDHLEPIQDPGRQSIDWADMADLWTPSGVEA